MSHCRIGQSQDISVCIGKGSHNYWQILPSHEQDLPCKTVLSHSKSSTIRRTFQRILHNPVSASHASLSKERYQIVILSGNMLPIFEDGFIDAEGGEEQPESLVLVVMTGGTICMRRSPDGLIPERGFLENAMAPRPEFNDGLEHNPVDVKTNDIDPPVKFRTLRTPISGYGKRIR